MEPISISMLVGKFFVKRLIRKSIAGSATSADMINGYRGLDLAGDQDGKTEIQDAIDFGKDEIEGVSKVVKGICDFLF